MLFTQLREYSQSIYFRRNAEITSSLLALFLSLSLTRTQHRTNNVWMRQKEYMVCVCSFSLTFLLFFTSLILFYFIL